MKTALKLVVISLCVVALTGCSGLSGTWKMQQIEPESARGNFNFNGITFASDGTYTAEMSYGGAAKGVNGTYVYDKPGRTVAFKSEDGKTRSYHLKICGTCGKMWVWPLGDEHAWKATLKRK